MLQRTKRVCSIIALLFFVVTAVSAQTARWTGKVNPKALSSSARMWVYGPQASTNATNTNSKVAAAANIDVNDPAQDTSGGQVEPSVAAIDNNVMIAWTDASGMTVAPTTDPKASGIGVAFSSDGGKTFTDLVGLPNDNPNQQWLGSPVVVAIDSNHFAVGGLYYPPMTISSLFSEPGCTASGPSHYAIAVSLATVNEDKTVKFTNPIVVADGGDFCNPDENAAMLDKPWMAYDSATNTLAVVYTRFFTGLGGQYGTGQIEVQRGALDKLTDPSCLCSVVVWPEEPVIVNTGASVALAFNGNAYVAWERNWASNLENGMPDVYINAALIPADSSTPTVGGPDSPRVITTGQAGTGNGGVRSLDNTADIPGYKTWIANDFPRIALDHNNDRVIVVWNDASEHYLGDIFMRVLPFDLAVSGDIYKINDDTGGSLNFMPALSVRPDGAIVTSWYSRSLNGPNTALTDYFAEVRPTPDFNGTDVRLSSVSTDWTATASRVSPNFGQYTDNASVGSTTYFGWTDGRTGVTQPFIDQLTVTADHTLTASPASVTIKLGTSADVNIEVAANELFSGKVTFACSGLPAGVTCTFNPSSVTLSYGQKANAKMTVNTAAAVVAMNRTPETFHQNALGLWASFGGIGVFGGLFLAAPEKRKRKFWLALLGIVALVTLTLLVACGGGSSTPAQTVTKVSPAIGNQNAVITTTTDVAASTGHQATVVVNIVQ